jgi:hypothetical protein
MISAIPKSWLILVIMLGLLLLTYLGFNHFIQASLGLIVGYLVGKELKETS